MAWVRWALALLIAAGATALALSPREKEGTLGSYVTSLVGRTPGQRANAARAARALDGARVAPGAVFSFNHHVGSWTADRGYVRAPVSYEGELVSDWGGGVCQTSTTLYNAALIAGLDVVQRHRHNWAPKYIAPGRDAAVAQMSADLCFRNPYPWTVTFHARATERTLRIAITGSDRGPMAHVWSEARAERPPAQVLVHDGGGSPWRIVTRGIPGPNAVVYRSFLRGPHAGERESVSQDSYPAMPEVVAVGDSG